MNESFGLVADALPGIHNIRLRARCRINVWRGPSSKVLEQPHRATPPRKPRAAGTPECSAKRTRHERRLRARRTPHLLSSTEGQRLLAMLRIEELPVFQQREEDAQQSVRDRPER